MQDNRLVDAFKLMWPDRSSLENSSISDVKKLIQSELRDEFTHPRVRRTPREKYRIAMARISNLQIEEEIKQDLSHLYLIEMASITGNVNPD